MNIGDKVSKESQRDGKGPHHKSLVFPVVNIYKAFKNLSGPGFSFYFGGAVGGLRRVQGHKGQGTDY